MTNSEPTGAYDPLDSLIAKYLQAIEEGGDQNREKLIADHPEHADRLRQFFSDFDAMGRDASKFRLPDPLLTMTVGGGKLTAEPPKVKYLGDYELLGEIARGGMGIVYRAKQVSLSRPVAIKMILAGTYADQKAIDRFRAEAEAAANLDHPNILPIYEVGEHEEHQYFSMKLIEGGNLTSKLKELRKHPKKIAQLMAVLARAVHYAHQRGILHRDLKPANVLIDQDGTPYITDFGLAKKVDADDGSTKTGAVVGTPSYMAPEQARGEKGLTTAVDVYSLGAILYEALTGVPPFRGETVFETIRQVIDKEPVSPQSLEPTANRDLSVIALKCLAKQSNKRYTDAGAFADDLERFVRGEPIQARPVSRVERVTKWIKRNPVVSGLVAALLLISLTGTGVIIAKYLEASYLRGVAEDKAKAEGKARAAAEAAEEKGRLRLIRSYLERGSPFVLNGEIAKSLPWLTAAWLQEPDDEILKLRVSMALRRMPRVARFYEKVTHAEFIDDEKLLLLDPTGLRLIDWVTEKPIWGPIPLLDPSGEMPELILSPDRKRGAIFDARNKQCRVFDLSTGKILGPVLDYPKYVDPYDRPVPAQTPIFNLDGTQLCLRVQIQTNRESYFCRNQIVNISDGKPVNPPLDASYDEMGEVTPSPTFSYWLLVYATFEKKKCKCALLDEKTRTPVEIPNASEVSCGFSPDGRLLLVCNDKLPRQTKVWDLSDGQQAKINHFGKDNSLPGGYLLCSPDGKEIVTVGEQRIYGYDSKTFELMWERRTDSQRCRIGPGNRSAIEFANSSVNSPTRFFNRLKPEPMYRYSGLEHTGIDHVQVDRGDFSPDGELFATIAYEGDVVVFQCSNGLAWTPPLPHGGTVSRVRFSPNHRFLLTSGRDARIWDLSTTEQVPESVAGAELGQGELEPSQDKSRIFLKSPNMAYTQLDHEGKSISRFTPPGRWTSYQRSRDGRRVLFASFHPPEGPHARWVYGNEEQYLQLWDADAGKALGPIWKIPSSDFLLSPDGSTVVFTQSVIPPGDKVRRKSGRLVIYDATTGTKQHTLEEREVFHLIGFCDSDKSVVVHRSRGIIYSDKDQIGAIKSGEVPDNDLPSGGFVERIHLGSGRRLEGRFRVSEEDSFPQFRLSPDGSRILTDASAKFATLHETTTGQAIQSRVALRAKVRGEKFSRVDWVAGWGYAISPDGNTAITAMINGDKETAFRFWDTQTGDPLGPQESVAVGGGRFPELDPTGKLILMDASVDRYLILDRRFGLPVSHGPPNSESTSYGFDHDGRKLFVHGRFPNHGFISLQKDTRSTEMLNLWSKFLSGATIDASGRLQQLDDEDVRKIWKQIQDDPAERFRPKSGVEELAWLRTEALCLSGEFADGALLPLTKLIAMQPNRVEWIERRANQYFALARYQDADADFEKAQKIAPLAMSSLMNWAESLMHLKRYRDAERIYSKIDESSWNQIPLTKLDDRLNNLIRIGEIDLFRKRIAEELKVIDKSQLASFAEAIGLAGHVPDVTELLRLLPMLREIYHKKESNGYIEVWLAWVLYRAGEAKEAIPILREELKKGHLEDVTSLHLLLAACEAKTGDKDQAKKTLAKADELYTKFEKGSQHLWQLDRYQTGRPIMQLFRKEVVGLIEQSPK